MSYNGSGLFQINTAGQPVVGATVISSTVFNAFTADIATGLSTAITKNGQTTLTANIPMSGFNLTGYRGVLSSLDSGSPVAAGNTATYTPVFTAVTNVTTVGASLSVGADFARTINGVVVNMTFGIRATAGGGAIVRVSLPLASAMTDAVQLSGVGTIGNSGGTAFLPIRILGDIVNDEAEITFIADAAFATEQRCTVQFGYTVRV